MARKNALACCEYGETPKQKPLLLQEEIEKKIRIIRELNAPIYNASCHLFETSHAAGVQSLKYAISIDIAPR